jgi:hypothetical protein
MKKKRWLLSGSVAIFLILSGFQQVSAEVLNSDVEVLFINESLTFSTVVVEDVSTNTRWEIRLAEDHPNKNSILAILLTAFALDEVVRIRWETGSPPILLRAALNRL